MNILYLYQKGTPSEDIPWGLIELGHTVHMIDTPLSDSFESETCCVQIASAFENKHIDAVISFNFYPYVSNVCEQYQIPYISWLFDSPVMYTFTECIYNKCNYIFSFDKAFYEDLKNLGLKHIYHIPLAANTTRLNALNVTDEEILKYNHSLSFVGRFFENNNYNMFSSLISQEYHNYFNQLFQLQFLKRDTDVLSNFLNDNAVSYIKGLFKNDILSQYPLCSEKQCCSYIFLSRKFTQLERLNIFKIISEIHPLDMYTDSDTSMITNIVNHGTIDAHNEAHKLFFASKINLNFTQNTIRTGIPLRVFEIMGSGGFLLTNPQSEFADNFTPNVDFVTYTSLDELPDIINYYLTHENERREIAFNGYKTINEKHSYTIRLDQILKTVFPNKYL